jgi:hypothetical protein
MYYEPHRLFLIETATTTFDENGDPIEGSVSETRIDLGGCFLHDVTVAMMRGYAGMGQHPKWYVNLTRRENLTVGRVIEVTESDGITIVGRGKIAEIKKTSGMRFAGHLEYMTVWIDSLM